jgi:adenylate cyclase
LKKHLVRIALGVAAVLLFLGHAAKWYSIPFVPDLEGLAYDARLCLTMPVGVCKADAQKRDLDQSKFDKRIVIVDIDEKSLAIEGRWPWRRDRLGFLLDQLFSKYHVKLVGFDVVFAEKDESSGLKTLQSLAAGELKGDTQYQAALAKLAPRLEYDRLFAERIHAGSVVLGYYLANERNQGASENAGVLPEPVLPKAVFEARNIRVQPYYGYGANLPELNVAAAGAGHFNTIPDADGVVRRVPMLAEYAGAYYEALSLAVWRQYQRLELNQSVQVKPIFTDAPAWSKRYPGLEWLQVGSARIPVDIEVTALVPYRGPQHSFPYVSAVDVLRGEAVPELLKDRIVLVGTTAPGLLDLRSTPVDAVYPGVEIHANLIAGMLDGTIKQNPPYVIGAEFSLLLVFGTILALVLPLLTPLRATMLTAVVLSAMLAINLGLWQMANLSLPLASSLLMVGLLFALNMSFGYFVELRAKRHITGRFGQYVPPELVDEMSRHPQAFSMDGESREMSVLFSDVRGFTTISEGLDPKELSRLMNEFLTPLTQVIYRHRGTIDKYMGDCIMAFWGAPMSDARHARSAVLAGLEMQATMAALEPQFKARGWPQLQIGVGVNTGRMSVGNMGSDIRVAYTVMGDAVNLASRLEGLTKYYGVSMIVGESTRAAVPDFVFRELDRVRPKGKKEPVAIFEPLGPTASIDQTLRDEAALWHQALRLYRAQEWDTAELQLINLQQRYPGRTLYASFLERIEQARLHPPGPGWDGATAFDTK